MSTQINPAGHPKQQLRADIQALRGLAVLLVVFYHANLPGLPAGFLGVDIFFVISGFLITSLIKKDLEIGKFRFRDFYYRRAKRLLPAAYVVIAATVLLAPFFINEQGIEDMRAQVLGALTFTVNFLYWSKTGYFDAEAETKLFLHFWSLAIEEQYYLLMPLILCVVPRLRWIPLIAGLTCLSFAICIWLAATRPDDAFYLLHTRWWQLGLGSLGALLPRPLVVSGWLSWLRAPAVIILLVIPFAPTGLPHPGVDAAAVCLSTLIIILGFNGHRAERSLPVLGLAAVGNFSYSLYLVHWPVISFTKAAFLGGTPGWALALSILISALLAYALYRGVEEPLRTNFNQRSAKLAGGLGATTLILALMPLAVSALPSQTTNFAELRRHNYGFDRSCAFGGRIPFEDVIPIECRTDKAPSILILGDSYAMAWTSALIEPFQNVGLAQITMSACDPMLGMARFPRESGSRYNRASAEKCIEFFQRVVDMVSGLPNIRGVVLAGRFQTILSGSNLMLVRNGGSYDEQQTSIDLAAKGISDMAIALRAAGKEVAILAPPPSNGMNIGECIERRAASRIIFDATSDCSLSRQSTDSYQGMTLDLLRTVSIGANLPVIDMRDFLCDEDRCITQIDSQPLYRDYGHLSVEGAKIIGRRSDLSGRLLQALSID